MTTKRTPISRQSRLRITPEMVDLYRRGLALELHRALGLRPWHPSPFDIKSDDFPEPEGDFHTSMSWRESEPHIAAIRRQLEAALAAAERTPHDVV
jgi:hypothetical protein